MLLSRWGWRHAPLATAITCIAITTAAGVAVWRALGARGPRPVTLVAITVAAVLGAEVASYVAFRP